jgi:gamma-glutamyltranspeptidase/glutathione hydrolase
MMPPSSGGLAVLQMLGILQHFPIDQYDLNDVDLWHLYSQASRIAFADRERYAADADFVDVPLKALLAPHYLEARAQSINMQTDMGTAQALELDQKLSYANDDSYSLPSTSHFVIIDAEGNAVSMTTSIEMAFGSSLMVGGFLLNNQLTDFSLSYEREGKLVANRVEPGKRPRSSMSPMMVFKDEQPVLLVGSPGGSRIINYVAKTLIAHLDLGLDIQQSVNAPNVSHTNGKALMLEEGLVSETLAEQLRQKGHTIQLRDMNSGVHAIAIKGNNFYGAADPRREGMVATAPN